MIQYVWDRCGTKMDEHEDFVTIELPVHTVASQLLFSKSIHLCNECFEKHVDINKFMKNKVFRIKDNTLMKITAKKFNINVNCPVKSIEYSTDKIFINNFFQLADK